MINDSPNILLMGHDATDALAVATRRSRSVGAGLGDWAGASVDAGAGSEKINALRSDARRMRAQRMRGMLASIGALTDAMGDVGEETVLTGTGGRALLVNASAVSYVMVSGPIFHRECYEMYYMGGMLMSDLIKAMDQASGSATARALLVVDSPGGMAMGMDAVVDAVRRLTQAKPTSTLALGVMLSGAYMLGCNTDRIVATRLSMIGSLGAVRMGDLIDDTKALEMEGIRRETIQVPGPMKRVTPGPITPELLDHETQLMNEVGYWPLRDVVVQARADRGMTADAIDALQGATYAATQALEIGLIDGIVMPSEFVNEEMMAARAGGDASETRYRPGANVMGNEAKPGTPAMDGLAKVSAADLIAARPDVVTAVRESLSSEISAQVQAEVAKAREIPATAEELAKICGEDKALAFDLLSAKATVSGAQLKVIEVLRLRSNEAGVKIAQLQGVAAKGGGGGEAAAVSGVASGAPATPQGEMDQLKALVQGEMGKGVDYPRALHRAYTARPDLKAAHLKNNARKLI